MGRIIRKKCKHCNKLFVPDARNASRRHYCHRPSCRKASKKPGQRRWLQKDENRDYFRGPDHCARVRQWRQVHPGYWKRTRNGTDALQDPLILQPDIIIGLISNITVTGLALQDDIAFCLHRLQQLGRDILTANKGADDGYQIPAKPPTLAQGAQPVQLGRSTPGARAPHQ